MTALEQELLKELEQEKDLNLKLISNLESQELNFLQSLKKQQELYESNLSQIVQNYQKNIEQLHQEYHQMIMQERKAYLDKLEKITEPSISSSELQNELQKQLEKLVTKLNNLEIKLFNFSTEQEENNQIMQKQLQELMKK